MSINPLSTGSSGILGSISSPAQAAGGAASGAGGIPSTIGGAAKGLLGFAGQALSGLFRS
jgi:hypothetical protein